VQETLGENMKNTFIAQTHITISTGVANVWDALVNPEMIRQYMFGTNVVSDWKEGSSIVWKGEWEGKPYEDKGVILKLKQERVLQYSHFSPLSGELDVPEHYHTVTMELSPQGTGTMLLLSQDKNSTEEDREHAEKMWGMMLTSLKTFLEK
jgi:uncharacterized protein YndB with AHSA1/START domain